MRLCLTLTAELPLKILFIPKYGNNENSGGLIENEAQTTGYTNGAGYHQVIKFDKRFETTTPPYFPQPKLMR